MAAPCCERAEHPVLYTLKWEECKYGNDIVQKEIHVEGACCTVGTQQTPPLFFLFLLRPPAPARSTALGHHWALGWIWSHHTPRHPPTFSKWPRCSILVSRAWRYRKIFLLILAPKQELYWDLERCLFSPHLWGNSSFSRHPGGDWWGWLRQNVGASHSHTLTQAPWN